MGAAHRARKGGCAGAFFGFGVREVEGYCSRLGD